MFRIEFFVEDRHVTDILKAVAGKARDLRVVPVANVAVTKDTMRSTGDLRWQVIIKALQGLGLTTFTARDVREACRNVGFSPMSHGYYIMRALKAGVIKKVPVLGKSKNRYTYTITQAKGQ